MATGKTPCKTNEYQNLLDICTNSLEDNLSIKITKRLLKELLEHKRHFDKELDKINAPRPARY